MDTVRVMRSKDEAKASYDRMSPFYSLVAGQSERKFVDRGLQMLAARRGESILEIGFGTGGALVSLAAAVGSDGEVHGIDISPGMTDVTRRKLMKRGASGRVRLDVGDAVDLPYETGSFDAVFMSFTLELFDNPEIPVILAECGRVLAEGGRVCVVAMSGLGKQGMMSSLYLLAHARIPNYVDCRPIFTARSLGEAGFVVKDRDLSSMWWLPVETVLAEKVAGHVPS